MTQKLTERELQVLECWTHGMTSREVAKRLHITFATAKTHASRIFTKLGAKNRAHAVAIYLTKGDVSTSRRDPWGL